MKNTRSSINDIQLFYGDGPWTTKSNAQLNVLFSIPFNSIEQHFFEYNKEDLDAIGFDVRGLRSYIVQDIPKNSVGANEWHRLRHEIIVCIKGKVLWEFEDLMGEKREIITEPGTCLWIPPFILHTYKALQKDSVVQVITNTLFLPDEPSTHDTYTAEAFNQLKLDAKKHGRA